MQVYIFSDENLDSTQGLEADTSIEDAIKDLFEAPTTVVPLPPTAPLPPPGSVVPPNPEPEPEPKPPLPLPQPDEESVLVDGEWIPAPSNPDEPLGEGTPGWVEREQPLWKASSEHGGNLVILLPMSLRPKEVIIYAVSSNHQSVKELGRTSSYSRNGKNGNRTHWRLPKSGGAYRVSGHDTKLKVYLPDGTIWYDVLKPAQRHVMQASRHQDS